MNDLRRLLTEITKLTYHMETCYPELYRFLDENPATLPITAHPKVDKYALQEYLESLRQLLKRHLETHRKINHFENG
ncbi:MAG: hypothetical protein ACR2MT_03465 [Aurantibacter sp.]